MTTPTQHTHNRLAYFPVSMFSMVMGLAGTTIATEKIETLMQWSLHPSLLLLTLSSLAYVIIAVFYVAKFFNYRHEVIAEFNHPIRLSFFPTISIGAILLSVAWLSHSREFAHGLWSFGSALQLIFTLVILSSWIHHDRYQVAHSNPAWFIPIVGNILVPISGMSLGYTEISWFYFSIGIIMWLPLQAVLFNRFFFHPMMPAKLLPTLFILIAPPAVGCIAWVKLHHGVFDDVSHVLYYFGLFITLLLFSQFRHFAQLKFALPWWAYSFPMAAITIASSLMYEKKGTMFFLLLSHTLLAILSFLIIILLIKTINAIRRQEICLPE